MSRVSADIGGTFTDVVLATTEGLFTTKVLTTYDDPARGVMQGIEEVLSAAEVEASDVELVLHGTTLATNALIERRGAPTGLLTTEGHRDVLEMAMENRFEQYDVNIDRPIPLVPRHLRLGVSERLAVDGEVLIELDIEQALAQTRHLVAQGVEALAIGLLHSYANPVHEQHIAAAIGAEFPALSLSLSCEVCPEIREYERISTTVANAYVKPLMSGYLASLQARLQERGFACQTLMMTSGGGLTTLEAAARFPIRLVESGPAGGAILAAAVARDHDCREVVSFDMGGTTAKICLIDDGEPLYSRAFEVDRSYRFKKGSGLPVRIPVIEMVEIGAGGGSIASVDELRRLQVGPESAGSEPGPVCYGRGGSKPCVTDADVLLGKIAREYFAGGKLTLDDAGAERVMSASIGAALDLQASDAAFAVAQIVEENMASATRAHASEWGRDLAARSMIAFGGAAPLHAVALADKLKIDEVLIPAGAGVGSALGFLLAPIRFEVVRSLYVRLEDLSRPGVRAQIDEMFQQMADEARGVVEAGAAGAQIGLARQAFMRYVGQGYEVAVDIDAIDVDQLQARFADAYEALYGRTIPGMAIEVLSWTLAATAEHDHTLPAAAAVATHTARAAGKTRLYDGTDWVAARLYPRDTLEIDVSYAGPALVVEAQTTTVVPAGFALRRLADGTLVVNRQAD
ncbi:MAG: hydantoinase/oxoprolinase family protein [Pseudomonadota bacterium]